MWSLTVGSKITGETIKEFNTQSPRTTAIVGAAILEDALEKVISWHFPIEGETKKQLFKSPGGPFGNLDTKIKVAYTMGLISKAAFQDMTIIMEVRNKFAHRLDIAEFEHSEVKPACMDLTLIEKHMFPQGTDLKDTPDDLLTKMWVPDLAERLADPRGRLFLSVMLFHHAITVRTPHPQGPKHPPRHLTI